MKIEIPKIYTNYGDMDWEKYGGLFVRQWRDTIYHVVQYRDISELVDKKVLISVDDAHVDIADQWDWGELIEDSGLQKDDIMLTDELKAVILFEQYGGHELGTRRDFDDNKRAIQQLKWLLDIE